MLPFNRIPSKKKTKTGFSLIEVMIGMVILALVSLAFARGFLIFNKQEVRIKEKAFAVNKVIQMMEELRGLVASFNNVGVLDDYDDGAVNNPVLTIRKEVTDPADPISGNASGRYERRITILNIPNEPFARRVYIRLYQAKTGDLLAETVSMLRTLTNDFNPSQVYDVYVLSLENVPGWWISLSSMKPTMDNIIQDLQTRNPGLEWRSHWITRLAYGRDPHYAPFINQTTKTNLESPPSVYFYPGLMDKPNAGDFFYYVPNNIKGRINVDGTNQPRVFEYSMADQYNNAVRYPEERALYEAHKMAAAAAGEPPPSLSLRMLLEEMNSSPQNFTNALIINLHGEMIPFPPMRNYSDAAKDPDDHPYVRLVTHSENMRYSDTEDVNLRVYSYVMNPDDPMWDHDSTLDSMTLYFPNVEFTFADMSIRKVVGNGTDDYAWVDSAPDLQYGVDYTVTNPDNDETVITLKNSPLRHGLNGNRGLNPDHRLYNLEYIPCEVGNPGNPPFKVGVKDLTMNNINVPKNTARWVITINAGILPDGRHTFETRIGEDFLADSSGNKPDNISRSYVWVNVDVPTTEQYQFMGDPRHMPYADVKRNHGYNWHFVDIHAGDYEGFSATTNGYNSSDDQKLNLDVPRFWEILRGGLLNTNSIMNSITGYSYYYMGIGGEIGYDRSNGFPGGLPIIETPWTPTSSALSKVDEISQWADAPIENMRLIAQDSIAPDAWWGLYWIGELYPDSEFNHWKDKGNLPVGMGKYKRANFSEKGFTYLPRKQPGTTGASSFFNGNPNGNSANKYFSHDTNENNRGTLTPTGSLVSQSFNFPLLDSMDANRPFRVDHTGTDRKPPEWNTPAYGNQRTRLSLLETYYDASRDDLSSSALIQASWGGNAAFVQVNGLSPQDNFGAAQIGKVCVLNMIRALLRVGDPSLTIGRIPQVPLITIIRPSLIDEFANPSTVTVEWATTWSRWDGNQYTENYPPNFSETVPVVVNVKYSNNNGKTWFFADDHSLTEEGIRDGSHALSAPFTWDVSPLPRGNYLLRIEAYRQGHTQHYSYHQRHVYIMR